MIFSPPLTWSSWEQHIKLKAILCTAEEIRQWVLEMEAAKKGKAVKKC